MKGEEEEFTAKGMWKLDGSNIEFEGLLQENSGAETLADTWSAATGAFWFIEWGKEDQPVALFGSLQHDPDNFVAWIRHEFEN